MTLERAPAKRLALALISHAERQLPEAKRVWAEAMRSELAHIDGNAKALVWAAGCVVACYKEGRVGMVNSSVSRSVLALEWTVCFGFLSTYLVFDILDIPGIVTGNVEQMKAYFIIRGPLKTALGVLESLIAVLGPIGLVVAFRFLFRGYVLSSRAFVAAATMTLLGLGGPARSRSLPTTSE